MSIQAIFSTADRFDKNNGRPMELVYRQDQPKSVIEVRLCDTLLFHEDEEKWDAFCNFCHGRIYREWLRELYKYTPSLKRMNYDFRKSTQCLMLFRALCVAYLWAELEFKKHSEAVSHKLYDEYIIDYTGKTGRQPYFYYLPKEIHARGDNEIHLRKLYELALLFRLDIRVDDGPTDNIYFKPPNVPVTSDSEIGAALPLWDEIMKNISKRFQNERVR